MSGAYEVFSYFGGGIAWLLAGILLVVCFALAARMRRQGRLYRDLRTEHRNHRALIDNLSEGIYRSTLDGRQISANPALVKLNGYETEADLLASVHDIAKEWYVDPTRRADFQSALKKDGKVEDFVSEIYRHKTRERIWITESARIVHDDQTGEPLFYEGSVREITETAKRLQQQETFQKLTSQIPGGLFQLTREKGGRFLLPYASSGFRKIVAHDASMTRIDPNNFLHLIHDDDRPRYLESLRLSGTDLVAWDCEFRVQALDGKEKWLRVTATPESVPGGIMWHGYLSDVSVRKRYETEIEKLAFYDSLTGLPNRRLLLDRMNKLMRECANRGEHGALIFIDLDNFKTLNDTMGHDTGDAFLVHVAERLRDAVEPDDMVARMGGDEFIILLANAGKEHAEASRAAILSANRALSALRKDFQLGALTHRTSASLGVLAFNGSEGDADAIMKNADLAMYQAKSAGRNGIALFDTSALEQEKRRFSLMADLRSALLEETFELHYQPQVDASGRVIGAEALLRWDHPEYGQISPAEFVPLAEQCGLADTLGRAVMEAGIATLARWQGDPKLASLRLAINVSPQLLRDTDFTTFIEKLVARQNIPPQHLTLETTERVITGNRINLVQNMKALKAFGVRLSLDDFGIGCSSIAHLKQLPFDEMKINGSFVSEIEESANNRALVRTMLAMGSILDLTVVGEHVETLHQETFLRAFGCDLFQGFHYSPALPREEFERFVAGRPASLQSHKKNQDRQA